MPKVNLLFDRASGRLISAGAEEIDATQPLLRVLIDECGWDPRQIVSRPRQWRVPSRPSGRRLWPVDVAIFDRPENARSPDHIRVICECKKPDDTSGIEQLKIYLDREPHARIGIWFNGIDYVILHKISDGYQTAPVGTPIPRPDTPLHPIPRHVTLTYASLRHAPSLIPLFNRIRDRLAAGDTNVNRDEEILPDLSSLLLLKILDEQVKRLSPQSPLNFQCKDTPTETASAIRTQLSTQSTRHSDIFGSTEVRLSIDDNSIAYAVQELQNYRLLSNDIDSISAAFQVLRGKAYKGEEGQYFTPPSVVRIAVAAVDVTPDDRIIDPACGSGSFLASALDVVCGVPDVPEGARGGHTPRTYDAAQRHWATRNLFALDKDSVSVRLSKAYLSLLGDGSTHVFKTDSLRTSTWSPHLRTNVPDGSFSVALTNPPFGTKLKLTPDEGRSEQYVVCRKWTRADGEYVASDDWESREIGIVFLERCLNLLTEGGRLAIVLPDTYLFSRSYRWLVDWLCRNYTITHSINVPIEAFEPHCRAKTSIVVIRKRRPRKNHRIRGVLAESYGEDKHGQPLYRLDENGSPTDVLEDEMAEAAALLRSRRVSAETKLCFSFAQSEAREAGVLVASYFWRRPYLDALAGFASRNNCELVSLGDLIRGGEVIHEPGHGSPRAQFKGAGPIPYIKVSDIKNWRVNENPKYCIPADEAERLRGNRTLEPFDLLTPTRASKNIGLCGVVMPWQTHVVLTREIAVLRCAGRGRVTPWLLVVMMSTRAVNDQFRYLVQMQTNREDLGERLFEVVIPIPKAKNVRRDWEHHARSYFEALVRARREYDLLLSSFGDRELVDRP